MKHGEGRVDGLLVVPGLDGKHNAGSSQVIGYVLQGASNRDTASECHLGDDLNDSVFLFTACMVAAYVPTSQAAARLGELLAERVPTLRIFCPTEKETEEPDDLEECKLGSFIQMLRGRKTLAIPWVPSPLPTGGPDPMLMEKWPLIQAYGLEGVGRPGFFLQNFKVGSRS
jgi:hypothetical protein